MEHLWNTNLISNLENRNHKKLNKDMLEEKYFGARNLVVEITSQKTTTGSNIWDLIHDCPLAHTGTSFVSSMTLLRTQGVILVGRSGRPGQVQESFFLQLKTDYILQLLHCLGKYFCVLLKKYTPQCMLRHVSQGWDQSTFN